MAGECSSSAFNFQPAAFRRPPSGEPNAAESSNRPIRCTIVAMTNVRTFDTLPGLCEELGRRLLSSLAAARQERRDLVVAVSGGSDPVPFYEHLAKVGPDGAHWPQMQLVLVDERDVEVGHPDSNLGMVRRLWLDPLLIAEDRIHGPLVPAEDLDGAARDYEATLHLLAGTPAKLDWVLLGIGPDGHTASLFPGRPEVHVTDRDVLPITDSPKPPPNRLTLSAGAIQRAAEVHVLVTGEKKAEAVRAALEEETDVARYPTHLLRHAQGSVTWWLLADADGRKRRG
jgi:6-phosphogluconolactonase